MNYDKLEVGPPIDRLVAEYVMGWKWYSWTVAASRAVVKGLFAPDDEVPMKYGYSDYIHDSFIVSGMYPAPQYSTDIADAWKIIEKVNDRMWSLYWLPDARIWQASFVDVSPVMTCEAPTAPLAICFAALVAL